MTKRIEDIEALVVEATEVESPELFSRILSAFEDANISSDDLNVCVAMLLEAWGDSIEVSPLKANFCLSLAKFALRDSHQLRNALEKTARHFAPAAIPKSVLTRIIGFRDNSIPPERLFSRLHTAIGISIDRNVYGKKTKIFGKITGIDILTEQIEVFDCSSGKKRFFPLKDSLDDFMIFPPESEKYFPPSKDSIGDSFAVWLNTMRNAGVKFPEADMKELALFLICGKILSPNEFDIWLNKGFSSTTDSYIEQAKLERAELSQSRNVTELRHKLKKITELKDASPLLENEIDFLASLFSKPLGNSKAERIAYAEALGDCLSLCPSNESAIKLARQACGSFLFPDNPENFDRDLWAELPQTTARALLKILSSLKDAEYELEALRRLPSKCIPLSSRENLFIEAIAQNPTRFKITPDLYLWAWKNRSKFGKSVSEILSVDKFFRMLRQCPKNQTKKDLRNLILSNIDFQEFILSLCLSEDDIKSFVDAFNDSEDFSYDEKTTALVKISRHSKELKDFLQSEKGKSSRIFKKKAEQQENPAPAPLIVSLRSYRLKARELEDIINKQIPENSAAIAHARGYGDLRENAEYSAAKERQKFLLGRRASLERELALAKITDFTAIVVSDTVVIGTSVHLRITPPNGTEHTETYHLLGAWDGDPVRNIISCDSALAKTLQGKKAGESVVLGDGSTATIISVSPIPPEIANEYSKYEE